MASSWRFDREKTEIPERYIGTEKELLFRALKATARKFPGAKQIRAILSG